MKIYKVALIEGHDESAKGAVAYNGMSEYDFAKMVINYALAFAPSEITAKEFNRNNGRGIRGALKQAKEWGADVTVEFHFNWAERPIKKQFMILTASSSKDSQRFAAKLAEKMHNKMGVSLREDGTGVCVLADGARGADNVFYGKELGIPVTILLEPCYGNIKTAEASKIIEGPKIYAKHIIDSIAEICLEMQTEKPPKKDATFVGLVENYKSAEIEFPELKAITLAQWMLESGRVTSKLSVNNYNFGGIKYRDFQHGLGANVYKVEYKACDGVDYYFSCTDYKTFFKLYWKFLDRSPYAGWRNKAHNPEEFIKHIGPTYCPRKGYVEDVLKLLPEAKKLLGV